MTESPEQASEENGDTLADYRGIELMNIVPYLSRVDLNKSDDGYVRIPRMPITDDCFPEEIFHEILGMSCWEDTES